MDFEASAWKVGAQAVASCLLIKFWIIASSETCEFSSPFTFAFLCRRSGSEGEIDQLSSSSSSSLVSCSGERPPSLYTLPLLIFGKGRARAHSRLGFLVDIIRLRKLNFHLKTLGKWEVLKLYYSSIYTRIQIRTPSTSKRVQNSWRESAAQAEPAWMMQIERISQLDRQPSPNNFRSRDGDYTCRSARCVITRR